MLPDIHIYFWKVHLHPAWTRSWTSGTIAPTLQHSWIFNKTQITVKSEILMGVNIKVTVFWLWCCLIWSSYSYLQGHMKRIISSHITIILEADSVLLRNLKTNLANLYFLSLKYRRQSFSQCFDITHLSHLFPPYHLHLRHSVGPCYWNSCQIPCLRKGHWDYSSCEFDWPIPLHPTIKEYNTVKVNYNKICKH